MTSKLGGRSSVSTDSASANLSTSSTRRISPPLAFSFTFYLPLDAPIASCFYSEEPLKRTKKRTIAFDENEWGLASKPQKEEEDAAENLIDPAEREATNLRRERHGSEAVTSRKRRREGTAGQEEHSLYKIDSSTTAGWHKRSRSGTEEDFTEYQKRRRRYSPPPKKEDFSALSTSLPFARTINTSSRAVIRHLTLQQFSGLLTSKPVPTSLSEQYGTTLLRFFRFVQDPVDWVPPEHLSIFTAKPYPDLSYQVRRFLPDFEYIRQNHPLKQISLSDSHSGYDSIAGNRSLAFSIMSWIWDRHVFLSEVRWLVEKAPLPLFALVLERIAAARYLQAVERTKPRLISYLSNSPSSNLSPRACRAKLLISWLQAGGGKRWERFFGGSGSERIREGEEPWDWWFFDLDDQAELKCEKTSDELEEWERKEIEWENNRQN
ncbi:hypothetical protein JCM5350_001780 [Sporobolomyces pararoseus]